jgi:hypothetical protein
MMFQGENVHAYIESTTDDLPYTASKVASWDGKAFKCEPNSNAVVQGDDGLPLVGYKKKGESGTQIIIFVPVRRSCIGPTYILMLLLHSR